MSHRWLCILGCLTLLTVGCRKQATEPEASGKSPAATTTLGSDNEPATVAPTVAEADVSALLEELTQIVRKYSFEKKRLPANLNELVAGGYLSVAPTAPPDRKFSINPKTMHVVIEKL